MKRSVRLRAVVGLAWLVMTACGGGRAQVVDTVRDPVPAPAPAPVRDPVPVPVPVAAPAPVPAAASATDAGLPTDADLADSWARVFLRANPGPCQYVAYELSVRGPAGVASHVRGFMGRRDAVTRTELLPREELRRVFGALRDMGALELPHPPLPSSSAVPAKVKGRKGAPLLQAATDERGGPAHSDVPIYELSFRLGGKENTLLVADPYRQADRRLAAFINTVRRVAQKTAGDIGYHGPSGEAGAEGYLFIDSVPGARVTIDGVQLADETPILAYTLAPGSHTVILENAELGLKRDYKVRIQPGLTTSLEVDLR